MGLTLGCGPAVGESTSGAGDGSSSSTSAASGDASSGASLSASDATSMSGDDTTGADPATTMDGQTGTDDPTAAETSVGFIYGDPTGGGLPVECSVWEQDCFEDEKCAPWANDGGDQQNATRCSPVAENPGGVGDPCQVEGSFVSGVDTCEAGVLCTPLDDESLDGICVEMCSGSESEPVCDDTANAVCVVVSEVFGLCGSTCDPLASTCGDGQSCAPGSDAWGCVPSGDAAVGDPCLLASECVAGSVCVGADSLCPEGEDSCCSQTCDLSAPDPDANCTDGRTCEPFYEPGSAPEGYESVGLCWAE